MSRFQTLFLAIFILVFISPLFSQVSMQDRIWLATKPDLRTGQFYRLDEQMYAIVSLSFFTTPNRLKPSLSLSGPNWIREDYWELPPIFSVVNALEMPQSSVWIGWTNEIINSKCIIGPYTGFREKNFIGNFQLFWDVKGKFNNPGIQIELQFEF